MIYTVTFNPSLDYVIQAEKLTPGEINRAVRENIYPGGKGINVSVMLSHMGLPSVALGFRAGFTGENLEQMLKTFGCRTDFISLEEGFTRINVKIKAEEETEINGQGPVITKEAIDALYRKLDVLGEGDILILAGSIPATLPEDIYEQILERLQGRGCRFVVDATKDLLRKVLKYHPFLIKPNNHELGELFGVKTETSEEIAAYARKLQELGAKNVLVSRAGDGALLLTETGEVMESLPPRGTVVNSVGAGDSMVAGFVAGYRNTGSLEKAFQLGLAAGSATAFQSWLADRDDIAALLEEPAENFHI
ncbi:1-phosphofructokinase [Candidatus Bariatricus faecipullorum]